MRDLLEFEVLEPVKVLYKELDESVLYKLLVLYRLVRPRAKGVRTGRFAAQAPIVISTMTQNVGLKTCRTSGVSLFGGALYPNVNLSIGYATERKDSRKTPARVDL